MDSYAVLVLTLSGVFIAGFVGWTVKNVMESKRELAAFQLYVAENYIKKDTIAEFKNELRVMSALMYEIAGKIGVPVRRE